MRKLCKMLFLCALLVVAVLQFTGCGNGEINWQKMDLDSMESEERAEILEKAAEQEMNKLDSYTSKMELEFFINVGSNRVESTATNEIKIANQNSENYQYRSTTLNKTKAGDTTNIVVTTEGFKDGTMYRGYEEGDRISYLRSEVSQADFIAYMKSRENNDNMTNIFVKGAFTYKAVSEKTETGWLVNINEISENFLLAMERNMGLHEMFDEGLLEDIEYDIYLSSEMHYERIDIRFIIKEGVNSPSFNFGFTECSISYYDLNETQLPSLNITEYTEAADLRILDNIENSFDAMKNSENGKFTISISQKIPVSSIEIEEFDNVSYQIKNGKISYTCDSVVNDESVKLTYEDGTRKTYKIKGGEEILEKSEKLSETSQISFIEGLIEVIPFEKKYVKSFKETDTPGQYEVTVYTSDAIKNKYRKSSSYELLSGETYTLLITVNGDRVSSCKIDLNLKYRHTNRYSLKYSVYIKSEAVYEEY